MKKHLLLYLPVIHQGYHALFERHATSQTELDILGTEIIDDFPELAREVRAVKPDLIKRIVESLEFFPFVRVVTKNDLKLINGQSVIVADDHISDVICQIYLPESTVIRDHAFLRWDTKNVQTVDVISADTAISKKKFDQEILKLAAKEAEKSSDWFRQVGAILIKNGQIVLTAFNRRQPTPHAAYIDGDPRNFIEYGTDTHLRLTIHAEQAIIAEAAKQGISTAGASLYVTTFPCPDCAAVIARSGIAELFFSGGYAQLDGQKILKLAGIKIIKVT